VLFNLFFEVEPFAAILIAHRTHGCSQEFVLGGTCEAPRTKILGGKQTAEKGFLGRGSEPPPHRALVMTIHVTAR